MLLYFRFGTEVFKTIEALLDQSVPPRQILFVDNASGDGIARVVAERYAGIEVIEEATNHGYGGAMNRGIRRLGPCEAFLLLTHDAVLESGALAELNRVLLADESVAVVGPLLGNRVAPDRVFSAGGYFADNKITPHHIGWDEPLSAWRGRADADVEWLDGACQLIRRRAYAEVGPLDEDYFLYWEETAYHDRARRKGWTVRSARSAIGWQSPGYFSPYYKTRNVLRFAWRHRSRRTALRTFAGICRRLVSDPDDRLRRLRGMADFFRGYGGPERP